jgi:hypothetical protein
MTRLTISLERAALTQPWHASRAQSVIEVSVHRSHAAAIGQLQRFSEGPVRPRLQLRGGCIWMIYPFSIGRLKPSRLEVCFECRASGEMQESTLQAVMASRLPQAWGQNLAQPQTGSPLDRA